MIVAASWERDMPGADLGPPLSLANVIQGLLFLIHLGAGKPFSTITSFKNMYTTVA